jgi:hypothetical protein
MTALMRMEISPVMTMCVKSARWRKSPELSPNRVDPAVWPFDLGV